MSQIAEGQENPFGSVDLNDLYDNSYDKDRINRVYKFPASAKQAQVHRRANRFGYNAPFMKNGLQTPICPCCQNLVNTIPIPLCYGTTPDFIKAGERVFLLNSGSAFYFTFIKMCIYYLIMRFLICDAYNMWTSYHGHFCKENPKQCTGDYNSYLSGYNKHTHQDAGLVNIVDYLNIAVTIGSIIFFYFCRKHQYRVNCILDHRDISQDDFSILVEQVPLFIYDDETTNQNVKFEYQKFLKEKFSQEIKKWIGKVRQYRNADQINDFLDKDFYKYIVSKNKELENEPIVSSISLCYDLTEMETIDNQRQKLMEEYVNDETVDQNNVKQTNLLKHLPNQISILNDEFIELSKRFALDNKPAFNLSHFVGKAFITFRYHHYREYFLRQSEKDPDFFKLLAKPIHIQRPVKPNDVFWKNMKVSNQERRSTLKQSYFVMLVLLLFSLAVLVGVDQIQVLFGRKAGQGPSPEFPALDQNLVKYVNVKYVKQQLINYLFVVLLPAITNFVNFAIKLAMDKLTDLQRHKTKTHRVSSFIIKNLLSRFINTAIIYYILSVLHKEIGPLTKQGVVMKIMGLVGVSALVHLLSELVRPQVLLEFFTNIFRSQTVQDSAKKSFQIKLNKQVQDPEFAFAEQYTFYLVQVLLVSFYAVIVPAGVGILVLIFIVQYWLDKYNLFRRFSCPLDFNFFLTRLAWKAFECSLLVFAIGTFIFDMEIRVDEAPKYKMINLINIAISGVYVYVAVMGPQWLQRKIFAEDEQLYHKPYDQFLKKKVFKRTYWTENPATAFLKEKNLNDEKDVLQAPPDEKFVKKQDFDFFIALTEEGIQYETYLKADEDYYVNYDNEEYFDDVDQEPMEKSSGDKPQVQEKDI